MLPEMFEKIKAEVIIKNFFKPTSTKKAFLKTIEQVPKSPWITTDRKGANTFPFYNLPPEPRNISKRNFFVLLSFPCWRK